jgi:hypothetical protein
VNLTVWNRALGRQLCGACANRLQAQKQQGDNVAPSLAQVAAEALGRIGTPARIAIPSLKAVARSKDPRLAAAAEGALRQLQGGA